MKKIIVDTNWWISFILSKHSLGLPAFFLSETIDFYFSNELLLEINNTLTYSRSKKRINRINLEKFATFIQESVVIINTVSSIAVCRDKKDNFLLALAKDANADYLITRDQDLLVLKRFENTEIITMEQFIKITDQ